MLKRSAIATFILLLTAALTVTAYTLGRKRERIHLRDLELRTPMSAYCVPSSCEKLHLYTICNHPCEKLDLLIDSCKKKEISIHVLGLYRQWPGFGKSLNWLYTYICDQKLDDEAIIMMIDPDEILLLRSEEELLFEFKDSKKPILFYASNETKGSFIAHVGSFKKAMKEIKPQDEMSVQEVWSHFYSQQAENRIKETLFR
jgi:hypothetical protein